MSAVCKTWGRVWRFSQTGIWQTNQHPIPQAIIALLGEFAALIKGPWRLRLGSAEFFAARCGVCDDGAQLGDSDCFRLSSQGKCVFSGRSGVRYLVSCGWKSYPSILGEFEDCKSYTSQGDMSDPTNTNARLGVLDGWRAISILLVLAAHLLPLGPKFLRLNEAAAAMGMALFFTLSGFLITRLLRKDPRVGAFLIKRFFRIIPLAWLGMAVVLLGMETSGSVYLSHFFFYANLPKITLVPGTSHLWSLCVEMQFYVGIAIATYLLRNRALFVLPMCCLAVTGYRVYAEAYIDIVTIRRVDEILAGCVLALIYEGKLGTRIPAWLKKTNTYFALVFLAFASHPQSGWLNYIRPYAAAFVVGTTLYGANETVKKLLESRTMSYIATVSYALYVIHGVLVHTWLGAGEQFEKYAKRPLLLAATFILAHFSTFYMESRFIALGKRLARRQSPNPK